jgi:hypothetical protein
MKVKYFDGFWTRAIVAQNPNWLFVYGDNDAQRGRKGQAIIRDMPNSIGIPVKKMPNHLPESFYTDLEIEKNKKKIDIAIQRILLKSEFYEYIVLPRDGFGTGLARLSIMAPNTFEYLNDEIDKKIKIYEDNVV